MALLSKDIKELDINNLPLTDEMLKDMGFVITEFPWGEIEYFTTLHSEDGFTFALALTRYTWDTVYTCKWTRRDELIVISTLGQLNKVMEDLISKQWL